ncbi:hypothetical protein [Micromonospora sp. I033]
MTTREPTKPAEWVQALAAVLAVIMAWWAVAVGRETLEDQKEINRSQKEINERSVQRTEQRFVSRVAWWWLDERHGSAPEDAKRAPTIGWPQLRVQNRSPIPLKNVRLNAGPKSGLAITPVDPSVTNGYVIDYTKPVYFWLPPIPPCVTATFAIRLDGYPDGGPRQNEAAASIISAAMVEGWALEFDDAVARWSRSDRGISRVSLDQGNIDLMGRQTVGRGGVPGLDPPRREAAQDCGEGG